MEAAYAALVSLLNTMDLIHNHPRLSISFDKKQFESLREKVDFLVDFAEHYSDGESEEEQDLVGRIAVAVNEAEDILEAGAADRIRAPPTQQSPIFLPDLQKIIEEIDFIKEKVIRIDDETQKPRYSIPPPPPPSAATIPPAAARSTSMLGFDGYVAQLLDDLTGHDAGRRIIPISGMGGIGKTTLARNLYEDSRILRHFNVRVWISVSQEFNPRKIYLQALSCLGVSTTDRDEDDDRQLSLELYRILFNRRYLIILDDVWSVEAWEKINFYFPENKNGSRIIVTTRESKLVDYFGSSALAVDFLDEENSLKLFHGTVFGQEACPPELEEVGNKILKKCKGLPLAIVVIGGLLRKSPGSREYWEEIAKEKSLILDQSGESNEPLSILSLSYKHLPLPLKSCFVYLGLYPEDDYFFVHEIIRLWVAEGFIKPNTNQSLEEVAKDYIEDLVDRNLLFLRVTGELRNFFSYGVHDLVRDMCMTIAEDKNLFRVQRDKRGRHHIEVDEKATTFYRDQTPIPRPRLFRRKKPSPSRVLARDMCHIDYNSPEINLRVLDHAPRADAEFLTFDPRDYFHTYELPSSISLLWSLQTLIVNEDSDVAAPSKIWKMPQLRHIEVSSIKLPNPLPSDDFVVLHNLHTLENVENLVFTEEVCKRIPNIKQLKISYCFQKGERGLRFHLENIGRFDKLEKLHYSCLDVEYAGDLSRQLKLPNSLKELTLYGCELFWSDLAMISSLPHLEILNLQKNAMVGDEWDCDDQEFGSLKHLQIERCEDLIKWVGGSPNFPELETLSLRFLSSMDEIPSGIGEIPTLKKIYMKDCSELATISAAEILQEQENLGNLGLRLQLDFSKEAEAETWKVKVEELDFTYQNLQIFSSGHGL